MKSLLHHLHIIILVRFLLKGSVLVMTFSPLVEVFPPSRHIRACNCPSEEFLGFAELLGVWVHSFEESLHGIVLYSISIVFWLYPWHYITSQSFWFSFINFKCCFEYSPLSFYNYNSLYSLFCHPLIVDLLYPLWKTFCHIFSVEVIHNFFGQFLTAREKNLLTVIYAYKTFLYISLHYHVLSFFVFHPYFFIIYLFVKYISHPKLHCISKTHMIHLCNSPFKPTKKLNFIFFCFNFPFVEICLQDST